MSSRMDQTAKDLKLFEERLVEVVNHLQPSMWRCRITLFVTILITIISAWNWLSDPQTAKLSFFESITTHRLFTLSCLVLLSLFFCGIHKRIVASSVITTRCRMVLNEYNLSCDDSGRLILKPTSRQH